MVDSHGARTGPEASSSVNWMVKVISSLIGKQRCWGHSRLAEIQAQIAGMVHGCGCTVVLMINRQANSVKRLSKNGFNLLEAASELRT